MDSLYHCEHLQPFRSRSEALLPFPERNYWFAQTPTAARGLPLAAGAHCVVLSARRAARSNKNIKKEIVIPWFELLTAAKETQDDASVTPQHKVNETPYRNGINRWHLVVNGAFSVAVHIETPLLAA
jgi:hypothetical protein